MAPKKPQPKPKKQALKKQAAKHLPKNELQAAKAPLRKAKAKAKAAKPVSKPKATATHHLAARVAAMLGVNVEQALERAVHELAERLGLHKLAEATAPAKGTSSATPGLEAKAEAQAAKPEPKPAAKPKNNEKTSANNLIDKDPLDMTPLAARTMSSSSPRNNYSPNSLPKRLYLALDGRGLDGSGMPLEVIDLPCSMGSSRRNTIWINSPRIETHHAQIIETDEGWVFEDLNSEHGTTLEGEPVKRRVLENGDLFLLAGYLRLKVEMR
jgi:hypothetical protein